MQRKRLASGHLLRSKGGPDDLHYFPRRLPDEHLWSLVARFVRHSGFTAYAAREILFGNPGNQIRLDTPTNIDRFCSFFIDEELSDPDLVIADLTPYRYVTAYMDATKRETIAAYMRSPPDRTRNLPAIGIWNIKRGEVLRFCRACHDADRGDLQIREPYWRRSHQLKGVAVCTRHGNVLQMSKVRVGHHMKDVDALPNASTCPDGAPPVAIVDESGLELLAELAKRAQELLASSRPPESIADITDRYRKRAATIGLMTRKGFKAEPAAISFSGVWRPALPAMPYLLAADGLPSWWLQRMFTQAQYRRPIEHPLPHLLVEIWLDRATKLDQDDPRVIPLRRASAGRGQVAGLRNRMHDGDKAAEVPRTAAEIKARLPEQRVTRTEIARVLGLPENYPTQRAARHWPLTSAAMDVATETPEAFFRRRLFRQMDLMLSEGHEVTVERALQRIGHRLRATERAGLLADYRAARQTT